MNTERGATVSIIGLDVPGRHGVYPQERELGQRFVVDVVMELDNCPATASDEITDTVDYAAVSDAVAAIIAGPPVRLLEHLAQRIAERVLAERHVDGVEVTVRKPHVAIPHTLRETTVKIRRRAAS